MRWSSPIGLFAALFLALLATPSLAVKPADLDPARAAVREAIAKQLDPRHSFALVIGVSDFDNPGWPHLDGVRDEVESVTGALEAQGFDVSGPPVGRLAAADLQKAIHEFFRANGDDPQNRLIVYIATHGYSDPAQPNAYGYLVASDSSVPAGGIVANGYSQQQLSAELSSHAAAHIFLFFDSCFSGAMVPDPTRGFGGIDAGKPAAPLSPETANWARDLLARNARLVLTAGDATETVPDRSLFGAAVVEALSGAADTDGDGLILGTEIAQYVRGHVARGTRLIGHPNDPVFAVIPKLTPPRPDSPAPGVDYTLQGDFLFLSREGPKDTAQPGLDAEQTLLAQLRSEFTHKEILACVDCPTMVRQPEAPALALASTEITYAEWDACFREMGCNRYLPDDGFGRGDRPAGNVTWLDALQYLTWLNAKRTPDQPCVTYRLPTEAEWSEAALYRPSGIVTWPEAVADSEPICWGCGPGDDGVSAMRTGSSPADAAGLHDMVGNLWEWVDDGQCGLNVLSANGSCSDGAVMGGSYATTADALPHVPPLHTALIGTAPRTGNARPWSSPTIGFRVACDVGPGS